jgi:lipopolysaccharide assembly protein A
MRIITYLFLLIIVVVGFTFACLNAELVSLNYYIGQRLVPLSLLLAIALFIGSLIGCLSSLGIIIKLKKDIFVLHQRMKHVDKEIEALRETATKEDE